MYVFRIAVIALFCRAADGQVSGEVVDVTGGAIPRATIRVLNAETRVTLQRCQTDQAGRFHLEAIPSGRFLIAAWAPGFKEKLIPYAGAEDVRILLDLGGCDTPGMICDYFWKPPPDPHPIRSQGELTIHLSEAVDLDRSP